MITLPPQVPASTSSNLPASTSSSTPIDIFANAPASTSISTPVTLPINPLDRQLIEPQNATINLSPNNQNANESLNNLFGDSNGRLTY